MNKTMKFNVTLLSGLLVLSAPAAVGEAKVKAKIMSCKIEHVPEREQADSIDAGTELVLELSSAEDPKKALTGAIIDASNISFKDSTGKDLLKVGKETRAIHDQAPAYYGGNKNMQNQLLVYPPSIMGRDRVKPGCVYLRCHALATPAKGADRVTIQGEIKVLIESSRLETKMITVGQLTSQKEFKLGELPCRFDTFGAGVSNGKFYTRYDCVGAMVLKDLLLSKDAEKRGSLKLDGGSLLVFGDDLKNEDEIAISYSVPKEVAVKLDLEWQLQQQE